jgi:pimeloyl-ACP methyl ester carboxylesterase
VPNSRTLQVLTGAVIPTTPPTTRPGPRLLRLLRRLLLVVLLLVLVLYGAGGWYFAGRIRSDGLDVKAYPVERHLTLSAPSGGTVSIRIRDASETRMLQAPSTFGLKWKGGYGRVSGPVVSQSGDRVVRRFEVVTGAQPTTGTKAEIDLVAFPDDPRSALGPDVDGVTYASPGGGRFPAWFVRGGGGDQKTWAILVHGKGGSRMEMFRMTRATRAAGLPSLDITYRNDEGLRRDPSDHYQYGLTEWQDLEGAVAYASAHGAERVVLGADSMGGGIVASYLRHQAAGKESGTADAPRVVGLVLDAPMLDFGETVSFGASQLELPVVGHVPQSLTWTAKLIAGTRYDIDWDALDYLSDTSWLRVPTLVFHGTSDKTVPIATSRELAKDKPDLVTLVETKGVEHVRSWNADPTAYDARVRGFVQGLAD